MIRLTGVSPLKSKIDMLALPVCGDTQMLDDPLLDAIAARAAELDEFSGEAKQQVVLYDPPGSKIKRALCMGIGKQATIEAETLRAFAGRAVKAAITAKQQSLVIAVPLNGALTLAEAHIVQAVAEGACLANHVFDRYKAQSKERPLRRIVLLVPPRAVRRYKALVSSTAVICGGTLLAREWINIPANHKVPARFASMVTRAAKDSALKIEVHNDAWLRKHKFGALLAVASGSVNRPRLVEMTYAPAEAKETVVLVGKGVTFDTGGINLKPSSGLSRMKVDMSGAAAVAATLISLAKLKPRQRVIGVLPLVENMPSGSAIRPGDIVTSFTGKTVEIGNTDAEGRLILIDAMAYAIKKYQPATLLDLATLTGACKVALGDKMAAVFSPDDSLSAQVTAAGDTTHERCWPLPLPEDYKKLLQSDLADINNMPSTHYGAAITAALFLSEFVGRTRWAHIDIAGPVFDKKGGDYCGPGGTGFGVRLLCDLIQNLDLA